MPDVFDIHSIFALRQTCRNHQIKGGVKELRGRRRADVLCL